MDLLERIKEKIARNEINRTIKDDASEAICYAYESMIRRGAICWICLNGRTDYCQCGKK